MTPHIKLALLGGLAAVVGTPIIIFFQSLLMNMVLLLAGGQSFAFPWDLWLSSPWSFILRFDSFVAGFIAVFLIAPFAIRRIDLAPQLDLRTGTRHGALAGFICCEVLAIIRLSTDFVGPRLYRDGFSALPDALGLYTIYLPVGAITYGPFAAMFGGCTGAIMELYRRKGLRESIPTAIKKVD